MLGRGKCITNDINCSRLKVPYLIATLHFSWYPASYSQRNIIAYNNTGSAILGISNDSSEEQKNQNIDLINNIVSSGLIGGWPKTHRYINAFIKGNSNNNVHFYESTNTKIIFERCFHDGTISGVTEESPITSTSRSTNSPRISISFPNYKLLYEAAKRYTRACKNQLNRCIFIFIFIVS